MTIPTIHSIRKRFAGFAAAALLGLLLSACYPTITIEAAGSGRTSSGATVTVRTTIKGNLRVVILPAHRPGSGVWVERPGRASFRIPPGHYPPPGMCRVWFPERPPGQQSAPGDCAVLERQVPSGAYLVYG
ncbi:MAG TPA: hypothetical protein VFN03_07260 [Trueperaceae bacterium]|nr:hypothetical protein [Trueperaceae bacterium]